MNSGLPAITETKRQPAPAVTPQALAWHRGQLWIGSRDLRRVYAVDAASWNVTEELVPPGIPWAAVSAGDKLWFTLGEGDDDDRYVRSYMAPDGFSDERIVCPGFTGSYLSHDGEHLYLSQWYKHAILKLDRAGNTLRTYDVGEEICGHHYRDGQIYVLRGTEQHGEHWKIARFDPRAADTKIEDLAEVPFACRSLTHDGEQFWTNHRAANETIAFALP